MIFYKSSLPFLLVLYFFSFCFYSADYTVIHFLLDSFFNIAGDYYVCTTQNNWGQGIDGYFCIGGGFLVKKKGGDCSWPSS